MKKIFCALLLCLAPLWADENIIRKSSFPYVTGDTWRFLCDWRLTPTETFNPKDVKAGDTIFVEYQLLHKFRKMARKIKHPFIVISPNVEGYSDGPLPGPHEKLLRIPNVAGWFVQNLDRPMSDRLFPIPIGLCNTFWQQGDLKLVKEKERDIFCYVNFSLGTNWDKRKPCWDYFENKNWAQKRIGRPFQTFLDDLSRSVFVISPPGNGLDCHRTWEALYFKCYPVVLSSTLDPLYEGLPVVVVNSWDEVTEELLLRKKAEFDAQEWAFERAYIPYWFEKVEALQHRLRNQNASFWSWFKWGRK
ncbi:MAG: hypothetical protein KGQ49_05350 [Verrucomicrobia bacterium]|nr:hypothetical protein [Verrucomicrobiota bacterium]MBU6446805.1 hypothetical protein [Verrucomicrobiota bacterium]MDE3048101.1 hypothetical protein [Verrucomicrobiota bacterium]